MKVVVALRTANPSQARQFLAEQACEIHRSRFEAQEPALRNLIDGLYRQGLDAEQQGASLSWFLLDADLTPTQWLELSAVAVCFSFDWFQQQTAQIRYLKGIAYCDAAASWAALLPINGLGAAEVQSEGALDWQGSQSWKGVAAAKAPVGGVQAVPASAVKKANHIHDADEFCADEGSSLAEGFSSAEGSLSTEGSLSAHGSLPTEGAVSADGARPTKAAIAVDDALSAEPVPSVQRKQKKSPARKILTKIISATKNIAQARTKITEPMEALTPSLASDSIAAEVNGAPEAADQSVVKKRGRPRKIPVLAVDASNTSTPLAQASAGDLVESDAPVDSVRKEIEAETPVPKKRGRPRKVVATVAPELDEEQLDLFV